nr:tigger transposable element-derived protein 2-like [Parasteatoda tepidariorum]
MFQKESTQGCKTSKERLTMLCCASMTGTKEKLLVIGKSKKPRCFKGVKNLPVDYFANKRAWMTTTIFNEWLLKWDKRLKRNIHDVTVSLKKINIMFLPPNTTSLIQPCDQGIICTLKAYYRKEMRSRILENMEDQDAEDLNANALAKKTNVLDAIHLLTTSWNNVSEKTIRNCFSHGGFCQPEDNNAAVMKEMEDNFNPPPDMNAEEFEAWMEIDKKVETSTSLTDEDICEAVCVKDPASSQDSGADDEPESAIEDKIPTPAQMREALRVLRLGVQNKADAEHFHKHYDYERFVNDLLHKNAKQSTIDDFFFS